jgi:ankyrin repeat protein
MTALIWASFHGELEQVKELVGKLSDVNVVDEVRQSVS